MVKINGKEMDDGAFTGMPGVPGTPPGTMGQPLSPRHGHSGSARDGKKLSALNLENLEALTPLLVERPMGIGGSSLVQYKNFTVRWVAVEVVFNANSGGGRGRIFMRVDGDAHGLSYNTQTGTYTGAATGILTMVDSGGNSKTITLTVSSKGYGITWAGAATAATAHIEVYGHSNAYANKLKDTFDIS